MATATATLAQLKTAYLAAHNLKIMLEPFHQGNPAVSASDSRFTAAEIDAELTTAVQALNVMAPATTVVGIAISGTATCAASATSQLTTTSTKTDLSTANVSATAVWSSDTPAKATVSVAGLVTGVAAGTSVITATYAGYSKSVTFTVTA